MVWSFPTGGGKPAGRQGGVIGSVAVDDPCDPTGRRPRLAAFTAIDGSLCVVSQNTRSGSVPEPDGDGP